MDVQILSRIQFGVSMGFHIIFPTLNLGLAMFLLFMEGAWVFSRNEKYLHISRFFTKIFALTFGMGVISGVVLAYQMGTNFGPFMQRFGNVVGVLLSYETFTVLCIEAGFLGVMLFGWQRLSPFAHYLATIIVALGTIFTSFWVISANSWMQFPTGYHLAEGQFAIANFWSAVFNPTFVPRYIHMLFASYITMSCVVAGIAAMYLLSNRFQEVSLTCLRFAMVSLVVMIPLQIFIGDLVGINVAKYQPAKAAAMDGVWKTRKNAPFIVFGVPNQAQQENHYTLEIPGLGSYLNTGSWDGEVKGLDSVSVNEQPKVAPVFYSFRVMIFIGLWLFLLSIVGVILWIMDKLESRFFLKSCVYSAPLGFIAVIFGWMSAEMGRQPWIINGIMRTQDAVSLVKANQVWMSLAGLVFVFAFALSFYLVYLFRLIRKGPVDLTVEEVQEHLFQYLSV